MNQVTVDAQISAFKSTNTKKNSEQALLQKHIPRLKAGDLLLLDRGYPSLALFFQLKAQGVDFCVRMKGGWWNEEEAYKLLKNRIELENFSGKTAKAVKQDFHAKIFMMTLTAAYAHPVEERVKAEFKADENRKYNQKINRTNAIAKTKDILVGVFIKKKYKEALKSFDDIVFSHARNNKT